MVDEVLKQLSHGSTDVRESGSPVDSAEQLLRARCCSVVYGAQRAAVDGRDGLQRAVPLVCGTDWMMRLGATVFTKNRDRLLEGDVAEVF